MRAPRSLMAASEPKRLAPRPRQARCRPYGQTIDRPSAHEILAPNSRRRKAPAEASKGGTILPWPDDFGSADAPVGKDRSRENTFKGIRPKSASSYATRDLQHLGTGACHE